MRIAIFGANSEIAKDFVSTSNSCCENKFFLFSRRPELLSQWVVSLKNKKNINIAGYQSFKIDYFYDVLINFIGVGDPEKIKLTGSLILNMTHFYDDLILNYLASHPKSRYIFLSSGIVYETNFNYPVCNSSSIRSLDSSFKFCDWYTISKVYAEERHREKTKLAITDLRIFSYFSHTQNTSSSSYLMGEIINALKNKQILKTSSCNIKRDYLSRIDFSILISHIIKAPFLNSVFDSYSKAPIDKFSILDFMKINYGLKYEISDNQLVDKSTIPKKNYFTENRIAKNIGYIPSMNSLENIERECKAIFSRGI